MKSTLLCLALLCTAPFATAQITLQDFSAFESANTIFVGDWALNGDPISGDLSPRAGFAQGAGFYNFTGGTNADTAGVYYFLPGPVDLTGDSLLQVSARLLAGNTATTFAISLLNFTTNESALAFFNPADFSSAGFTTVTAALTPTAGFDPSSVDAFLIGGVAAGTGTLNLAIDNLAVARPRTLTPVPEPASYGGLAAAFLATLVFERSKQRKSAEKRTSKKG